ncbi:MAG: glutathione S-transferase family protein [Pseudomonadota bacterium]
MQPVLVIGNKNYSSWSLRAWLVLREAGIEFTERRIVLDVADTQSELQSLGAASRVPVLTLDGQTIWDSLAIAEAVNDRWPDQGLWPADRKARAHARSVSAEMHAGFDALRGQMPMNCRAMGRKVELTDPLAADIDRVIAIWSDCYQQYGGDWLFGTFSIADAMYAPVVLRFRTYGINLPQSASHYPKRLLKSRAMQEWLAAAECESEVIVREELGQ